jgi:hypothetical protein
MLEGIERISARRKTEAEQMIEFECPWCAEGQPIEPVQAHVIDEFSCDTCGTVVRVVDEPAERLPLAA